MIKFKGVLPALLTPVNEAGDLNVKGLEQLIEKLLTEGADGFYVGGATGEGIILDSTVAKDLIRETMRIVAGRVPCIFHVARTNFREALELARYAEAQGAAAISAIPPIFFKYTDDDIVAYYKRLAESVSIPLVIYNNPNTGVTFTQNLLNRLFAIPNITAIKWTNYDFSAVMQLKSAHPEVNVINGPDEMALLGLTAGCDACIGTTYNFQLPTIKGIYEAFERGDIAEARRLQTLVCNVIGAIRPRNIILATRTIVTAQGVDVSTPMFPQQPYSNEEAANLINAVRAAGLRI